MQFFPKSLCLSKQQSSLITRGMSAILHCLVYSSLSWRDTLPQSRIHSLTRFSAKLVLFLFFSHSFILAFKKKGGGKGDVRFLKSVLCKNLHFDVNHLLHFC